MGRISIIGNQGVGKSFIFRKALKEFSNKKLFNLPTPNVNYSQSMIFFRGVNYLLFDTFSFPFPSKSSDLIEQEKRQVIHQLINSCDLIVWVINIDSFLFQDEVLIQNFLEKNKRNYFIIFNSFHSDSSQNYDFYSTKLLRKGIRYYFLSNSSSSNYLSSVKNIFETELSLLIESLGEKEIAEVASYQENQESSPSKVTIFGPPNSGKSTLLNSIVEDKRSVTSPLAGTTKEPVTAFFSNNNLALELVDTEGIVNQRRNHRLVLKETQIAIVVIDISIPLTKSTLQIISLAERCEKSLIIVFNKIDLVKKTDLFEKENEIRDRLKSASFVPIIFLSASEKKNIKDLIRIINRIINQSKLSFSKSVVSKAFEELASKNPPSFSGKMLKIYYAIHSGGFIHKFVVFVNNKSYVHFSYERYIKNFIRKRFVIDLLPIKIFFKKS